LSSRGLASLAIDVSRRSGRMAIAATVLLAIIAVALATSFFLPSLWMWVAMALLAVTAVLQAWYLGLIGKTYAVVLIACDGEGQWSVTLLDGLRHKVQIDSSTRVGARSIWLVLRSEQVLYRLLLVPFAMSHADWRGLQTRLRWLTLADPDTHAESNPVE
jgi:hypothetical protein